MNKLTKAAIAGGAGIILLMGGAGTFAVWNDVSNAGAATITAGNLDIEPNGAGVWSVGGTPIDIATYRIIPGTTLTYTSNFDVYAVGDGLTATVSLTEGSITAAATGNAAANTALAARLAKSAAFSVNGGGATTITASAGVQTVAVSVSIKWEDNAADNAAKLGAVDLSNFGITLTQTVTP